MRTESILCCCLLAFNVYTLAAQQDTGLKAKENYKELFHKSPDEGFDSREAPDGYGDVDIYAVVVGVGQYTTMPRLNYTDDDARLFYDHLKSTEGGGLPVNHIKLLVDKDATRQHIILALRQMSRRADGNDVFIFYFSGHGLNGAFLPVDYAAGNNRLSHDEVLQILQASPAKHKLCIADACHSGAMDFNGTMAAKGESSLLLRNFYAAFDRAQNGTALLMSSSAGEASLEDQSLRHGVFTYYLEVGMSGQADFNHDHIVDIRELFHYLSHAVYEHTEGRQSPVLTGDYDDSLPVAIGLGRE